MYNIILNGIVCIASSGLVRDRDHDAESFLSDVGIER